MSYNSYCVLAHKNKNDKMNKLRSVDMMPEQCMLGGSHDLPLDGNEQDLDNGVLEMDNVVFDDISEINSLESPSSSTSTDSEEDSDVPVSDDVSVGDMTSKVRIGRPLGYKGRKLRKAYLRYQKIKKNRKKDEAAFIKAKGDFVRRFRRYYRRKVKKPPLFASLVEHLSLHNPSRLNEVREVLQHRFGIGKPESPPKSSVSTIRLFEYPHDFSCKEIPPGVDSDLLKDFVPFTGMVPVLVTVEVTTDGVIRGCVSGILEYTTEGPGVGILHLREGIMLISPSWRYPNEFVQTPAWVLESEQLLIRDDVLRVVRARLDNPVHQCLIDYGVSPYYFALDPSTVSAELQIDLNQLVPLSADDLCNIYCSRYSEGYSLYFIEYLQRLILGADFGEVRLESGSAPTVLVPPINPPVPPAGGPIVITTSQASPNPSPKKLEEEIISAIVEFFGVTGDPSRILKLLEDSFSLAGIVFVRERWIKVVLGASLLIRGISDVSFLELMYRVVARYLETDGAGLQPSTIVDSIRNNKGLGEFHMLMSYLLVPLLGETRLSVCDVEILALSTPPAPTGASLVSTITRTLEYFSGALDRYRTTGSIGGLVSDNIVFLKFVKDVSAYTLEMREMVHADVTDHSRMARLIEKLGEIKEVGKNLIPTVEPRIQVIIKNTLLDIVQGEKQLKNKLRSGEFKRRPFCVLIVGRSQVGKSLLTDIINRHVVVSSGEIFDKDRRAMIRGDEKFFQNVYDSTQSIVIDDVGNMKQELFTTSPLEPVLRIVNNVRQPLPQASIERKDNCGPAPTCVVVTSNLRDANAPYFSMEPASLALRFDLVINVKVRSSYQKDTGALDTKKVFTDFKDDQIPDCWELETLVAEVAPQTIKMKTDYNDTAGHVKSDYRYVPFKSNGTEIRRDCSVLDLLGPLQEKVESHVQDQIRGVARQERYDHAETWCTKCKGLRGAGSCSCVYVKLQDGPMSVALQRLERTVARPLEVVAKKSTMGLLALRMGSRTLPERVWVMCGLSLELDEFSMQLFRKLRELFDYIAHSCLLHHLTWVPDAYYSPRMADSLIETTSGSEIRKAACTKIARGIIRTVAGSIILGAFGSSGIALWSVLHPMLSTVRFPLVGTWSDDILGPKYAPVVRNLRHMLRIALLGTGMTSILPKIARLFIKQYRSMDGSSWNSSWKCAVSITLAACCAVLSSYSDQYKDEKIKLLTRISQARELTKRLRSDTKALAVYSCGVTALLAASTHFSKPKVTTDLEDGSLSHEILSSPYPIPLSSKVITSPQLQTKEELINSVQRNLVFVTDTKDICRGIFLDSGYLLLPGHFFQKKRGKLYIKRFPELIASDSTFPVWVDHKELVQVGSLDLVLLPTHSGGSFRNIIRFFPEKLGIPSGETEIVRRMPDGTLLSSLLGFASSGRVETVAAHVHTGDPLPPFEATIYKGDTSGGDCGSLVIRADSPSAIYGIHILSRLKQDVRQDGVAIQVTQKLLLDAILKCRTPFQLPRPSKIEVDTLPLVPQSPVKHLPSEGEKDFQALGRLGGYTKVTDLVDKSPIYDTLTAAGFSDQWGTPAPGPRSGLRSYESTDKWLKAAVKPSGRVDSKLLDQATEDYVFPFFKGLPIRPLSKGMVVNGKPGSRFIKPMEMASSAGPPYNRPKKALARQREDGSWVFDKEIWESVSDAEEKLGRGERPFAVIDCRSKMEVRAKDSDGKIKPARKFQNPSLILNILVKKYFGPIFELLMMQPKISECAVGINPYSKQWDDLYKDIVGSCRSYHATDYSGFDQAIPNQVMSSLLGGYVKIAEERGYAPQDLEIMKYLGSCLVYPLTCVDGDLYELTNIMCSGIVGTSIIDGGITSLLKRVHFYSVHPRKSFREWVSLRTFGDDVLEGRSMFLLGYNQRTYAKFVEEFGMTITPASKKGVLLKTTPLNELVFLKRKFVFSVDHGGIIGPLDQDSILKSLFYIVRSKYVSPEDVIRTNLDRALIEMSLHGEKEYESFRKFVLSVPPPCSLGLRFSSVPYKKMVEFYKENYYFSDFSLPKYDTFENIDGFDFARGIVQLESGTAPVVPDLSESMGPVTLDMPEEVASLTPSLFDRGAQPDVDLNRFFERPVLMDTTTFVVGTTAGQLVPPKDVIALWLRDKRVSNRMANFANVAFDFEIEFQLNASPFCYGRLLLAYEPILHLSVASLPLTSPAPANRTLLSQMPHVYMDIGLTTRAKITIPMIWYAEWYNLAELLNPTTPMGSLHYRRISPVLFAKDPAPTFTVGQISTYCCARNFRVRGITSYTSSSVVPQAGSISQGLHKIANISDALIPVIGPLGTMVSEVGKSLGNIAGAFGYTRKAAPDFGGLMIQSQVGYTAITDTDDIVYRLSASHVQAISIGSVWSQSEQDDPLSFSSIVKRWAFLISVAWLDSKSQGTRLGAFLVAPHCQFRVESNDNGEDVFFYLPVCLPTLMTSKWTGGMMYRLTAICSPQHRGSLFIKYDPFRSTGVSPEFNVTRGVVWDLTEKRSITLTIPATQDTPYLETYDWELYWGFNPVQPFVIGGAGTLTNYRPAFANGYLSIYVMNPLCSPNSVQDQAPAYIMVEVCGCNDMSFAVPSSRFEDLIIDEYSTSKLPPAVLAKAPSPKESGRGLVPILEVGPACTDDTIMMGVGCELRDDLNKTYMGESILSFRDLLQRYHLQLEDDIEVGGGGLQTHFYLMGWEFQAAPWYRGIAVDNADTTPANGSYGATGANTVWSRTTHVALISRMFLGFICNMRHMVTIMSSDPTRVHIVDAGRSLGYPIPHAFNRFGVPYLQPYTFGDLAHTSNEGMAFGRFEHNPTLKVEVPAYSNYLFWLGRSLGIPTQIMAPPDYDTANPFKNTQRLKVSVMARGNATNDLRVRLHDYVACTDFRAVFFMGLPPMKFSASSNPNYNPNVLP